MNVRKQILIEPDQTATLERLASETGMTEAEIIRQAINRYIQSLGVRCRDSLVWEREHAYITSLMEQGRISGGRSWCREELYER